MGMPFKVFRVFLLAPFKYGRRKDGVYCTQKARWEKRTLSALGPFVPYQYHLCCCYNLTVITWDRLLVRIQLMYEALGVRHGFWNDQEAVFSYKCSVLIWNRDAGLLVVAYTKLIFLV